MQIKPIKPGNEIITSGRRGTVLEVKDTPNGRSAKVKMADRKIASWYWVKDLTAV